MHIFMPHLLIHLGTFSCLVHLVVRALSVHPLFPDHCAPSPCPNVSSLVLGPSFVCTFPSCPLLLALLSSFSKRTHGIALAAASSWARISVFVLRIFYIRLWNPRFLRSPDLCSIFLSDLVAAQHPFVAVLLYAISFHAPFMYTRGSTATRSNNWTTSCLGPATLTECGRSKRTLFPCSHVTASHSISNLLTNMLSHTKPSS